MNFVAVKFVLLSSFINNTLYVNYPRNTLTCFITFNSENITLHEKWSQDFLIMNRTNDGCEININSSNTYLLHFKLKYYLADRTYVELNDLNTALTNFTALNRLIIKTNSKLLAYKVSTILLTISSFWFVFFFIAIIIRKDIVK